MSHTYDSSDYQEKVDLKERIQAWADRTGYIQRDLANIIKMPPSTLANKLNGNSPLFPHELAAIEAALLESEKERPPMSQPQFDVSMADYIPFRLRRAGFIVAVGTEKDIQRAHEKLGGTVEAFQRHPKFSRTA